MEVRRMSFTGKTSDYASYIISAQQKQKEIDEWRSRFISPLENEQNVLTQNFSQNINSIEQQSRYDISSAYSAYKQSQQQINTSNVWTGTKNLTNSYLADQYALKFNNIANTKFSSFSDLKNKYVKVIINLIIKSIAKLRSRVKNIRILKGLLMIFIQECMILNLILPMKKQCVISIALMKMVNLY